MESTIQATDKTTQQAPHTTWSPLRRWVVSFLVILHLIGVIIAPLHFATSVRPGVSSPATEGIFAVWRPYIDAAFLNHGYFFFAPNPGPSHLVQYEVESEQAVIASGRFPDRNVHWPRLLYHRHFMLSETLNSNYVPPLATDGRRINEDWRRERGRYEALHRSYENHLRRAHGGDVARATRIEHRPPDWFEFFDRKISLTDDSLYSELRDTPQPSIAEQGGNVNE